MPPRENLQLARIFGIRIGVDWSWFFVLFIVIYILHGYFEQVLPTGSQAFVVAVLAALFFFASLLAHELGHALAARHLGLEIDGIDLWLFGGYTRTFGEVPGPRGDLELASAGPAMTAALTLVFIAGGLCFGSFHHLLQVALFESNVHVTAPLALFSWLALINLMLLVFNLVPAFPLDGGRIAQAIAWKLTGDRNRAIYETARLGRGFGYLLIAGGVVVLARYSLLDGVWLALIGFYLERAARHAQVQSRMAHRLQGLKVTDVMDANVLTIPAQTRLLEVEETFFLRHRWPWFAVVDEAGHYVGLLRRERVEQELAGGRPALTAAEATDEAPPWRIDPSATLESLLGTEGLPAIGAVVAVDGDGIMQGVVTVAAIRAALGAPAGV
jgi:Zn-dependent protease